MYILAHSVSEKTRVALSLLWGTVIQITSLDPCTSWALTTPSLSH